MTGPTGPHMSGSPSGPRVASPGSPDELPGLAERWGLRGTGPVVVLVGGADSMDAEAARCARHAIEAAVIPAVEDVGAVVVTGGTDAGVMRLVGEARRAGSGSFSLVGVMPADLVRVSADASADEGAGVDPMPRVQPDHTHALAVPGDRWGAETPWLFDLAEAVAAGRGIVTVVINGGRIARAEIAASVRRGHPVIVVEGTGRAADEIAAAMDPGRPAGPGDPHAEFRESGLVKAIGFAEDGRLRARLGDALVAREPRTRMTQPATGDQASATPMSYEDEMRELIARMSVSDEQRRFLRSRWLDQVDYMGLRASEAKRRFYGLRLATVVGGVVVPALVSISLAGSGRFDPNVDFLLRLLTFLVSAIVAVTASVEGFMRYGERWRHFRVNAELLKSEGWQYLTGSGPYRRLEDPDTAFQAFAARVEEVLRDDVDGFLSQVTRSSPAEKYDVFTKL